MLKFFFSFFLILIVCLFLILLLSRFFFDKFFSLFDSDLLEQNTILKLKSLIEEKKSQLQSKKQIYYELESQESKTLEHRLLRLRLDSKKQSEIQSFHLLEKEENEIVAHCKESLDKVLSDQKLLTLVRNFLSSKQFISYS